MSLSERNRLRLLNEIREDTEPFEEKTRRIECRLDIDRQRRIERAYNEIAECMNLLRYHDEIPDESEIKGRTRTVRINPMTEMFVNTTSQE